MFRDDDQIVTANQYVDNLIYLLVQNISAVVLTLLRVREISNFRTLSIVVLEFDSYTY